jgi:hypothetical protein
VCVSSVTGNFDGRSSNEVFLAYGLPAAADAPPHWWARLIGPQGARRDFDLNASGDLHSLRTPRLLGAADGNGDGRDEIFMAVDAGASTLFVAIAEVTGGALRLARVATGPGAGATSFALGGSVTHGGGLECSGSGSRRILRALSAWSSDGTTYSWEEIDYLWQDQRLQWGAKSSGTAGVGDPRIARSYQLRCGSFASAG